MFGFGKKRDSTPSKGKSSWDVANDDYVEFPKTAGVTSNSGSSEKKAPFSSSVKSLEPKDSFVWSPNPTEGMSSEERVLALSSAPPKEPPAESDKDRAKREQREREEQQERCACRALYFSSEKKKRRRRGRRRRRRRRRRRTGNRMSFASNSIATLGEKPAALLRHWKGTGSWACDCIVIKTLCALCADVLEFSLRALACQRCQHLRISDWRRPHSPGLVSSSRVYGAAGHGPRRRRWRRRLRRRRPASARQSPHQHTGF